MFWAVLKSGALFIKSLYSILKAGRVELFPSVQCELHEFL